MNLANFWQNKIERKERLLKNNIAYLIQYVNEETVKCLREFSPNEKKQVLEQFLETHYECLAKLG